MSVVHIESVAQFDEITTSTTYCIVDFSAEWCGPCKAIAPLYSTLAGKHSVPGFLAFLKVDVDAHNTIAEKYGVRAMPTFKFLKDGQVVAVNGEPEIRGAAPPKLIAAVEKLFGLAQAKAAGESA